MLKPFDDVTHVIQGNNQSSITSVLLSINMLFDLLEKVKLNAIFILLAFYIILNIA